MEYTKKILYQSNYWYNDGLRRAKIRDLTGAVTSLKKSLQYNRGNIAARNLLGLVYYGRGEIGEALVEWILSKNLKSHENIANYYIQKLQENAEELETMNQAVQKYNQSLQYCRQNGEDLAIIQLKKAISAHPTFLKAYQLLALLYMHTEQYTKARQVIKTAHKLDTTNPITLSYMHELQQVKNAAPKAKVQKKEDSQTVTYNIGNETIIQPVAAGVRENRGMTVMTNIVVGILVGVAVMWFLIMPAVNRSAMEKVNDQTIEFSDKIAAQDAQISALKTELESYRASSEDTETAKQTAESTLSSYEIVLNMYEHYRNEDMSDAAMTQELIKVNPNALGTSGKEIYDMITESVYGCYTNVLYNKAWEEYGAAGYAEAIEALTLLMQIDEGYDDGEAMYLLSICYKESGDADNARIWLEKVAKKYPAVIDTEENSEEVSEEEDSGE